MKCVCYVLLSAMLTVSALTTAGCHMGTLFSQPVSGFRAGETTPVTANPATGGVKTGVQQVVTKQVWLFWVAGIVCLCAAGALAYFGQIVAAIKVGIAGLILPIFAIWWSEHYALVIAAVLIGAAVWYLLTHAAARSAIAAELSKITTSIEKKT